MEVYMGNEDKQKNHHLCVRLDKEYYDKLDFESKAQRRSKSELVRMGLEKLFNVKS